MTEIIKKDIAKAIVRLGYKEKQSSIHKIAYNRFAVFVGSFPVGIYDAERHTFVD